MSSKTFGQGVYGLPDAFYEGGSDSAYGSVDARKEDILSTNVNAPTNPAMSCQPMTFFALEAKSRAMAAVWAAALASRNHNVSRHAEIKVSSAPDRHAVKSASASSIANVPVTPDMPRPILDYFVPETTGLSNPSAPNTPSTSNSSTAGSTPDTVSNTAYQTPPSTPGSVRTNAHNNSLATLVAASPLLPGLQRSIRLIKDFLNGTPRSDATCRSNSIKSWITGTWTTPSSTDKKSRNVKTETFPNLPVYAGNKRKRVSRDDDDDECRANGAKRLRCGPAGMKESRCQFERRQLAAAVRKGRVNYYKSIAPRY